MPTFGANDRFRAEVIVDDRPVEEFGLDGDTWVSSSKERGILLRARPPCIPFELSSRAHFLVQVKETKRH